MASRMIITFADFDRNRAQVSFDGEEILADGSNATTVNDAQATLRATTEAISLGVVVSTYQLGNYNRLSAFKSSDSNSQTNVQWRCFYEDNVTGQRQSLRIPCADLGLGIVATASGIDRTVLDLSAGAGANFKNAFEAYVLSDNGNAVTLSTVEYIQ